MIIVEDVKNNKKELGCVVLASGFSQRFGSENKLLFPFKGKPLAEYILQTVAECSFLATVCVTQWVEVVALAKTFCIQQVFHRFPEKNDTIRLGIDFLLAKKGVDDNSSLAGIMFCTADQPFLSVQTMNSLCDEFCRYPQAIIRPSFVAEDGKVCPGNPVIFPAFLFDELRSLENGQSGRNVIVRHRDIVRFVPVLNKNELLDVDTVEQLEELQNL